MSDHPLNIEDFGPFKLSVGRHDSPADGMCVMEMVSFLEGEEWSDEPKCVCPQIAYLCRTVNDAGNQAHRDRLQTYIPRLVGTRGNMEASHNRERILSDWISGCGAVTVLGAIGRCEDPFPILDAVLAIGPSGDTLKPEHVERIPALRKAVGETV